MVVPMLPALAERCPLRRGSGGTFWATPADELLGVIRLMARLMTTPSTSLSDAKPPACAPVLSADATCVCNQRRWQTQQL